jgi:GTP-binding protein HflX
MEEGLRQQLKVGQEKVILVACMLPDNNSDPNDPLGELRSLVDTAGGIVVDELFQNRNKPDSATYIGSGKVRELAEMVQAHGAQAVVFDNDLSPAQISNIEEEVKCKVLDRSEVILDIFAARAQTNEANLHLSTSACDVVTPRTHHRRLAGGHGYPRPGRTAA